jgi:hypothetical protein
MLLHLHRHNSTIEQGCENVLKLPQPLFEWAESAAADCAWGGRAPRNDDGRQFNGALRCHTSLRLGALVLSRRFRHIGGTSIGYRDLSPSRYPRQNRSPRPGKFHPEAWLGARLPLGLELLGVSLAYDLKPSPGRV